MDLKEAGQKQDSKQETKQEKQQDAKVELLAKSEISLIIDTYDDIFSDFDPRPYTVRALSDDFLFEAKKASRETKQGHQLRFMVPTALRKSDTETTIRKRLREHFKRHADLLEHEQADRIRKGILITVTGFALAAVAAAIAFYFSQTFLATLLIVLLEPAGWFTLWHGLDMALFETKEKAPELEFYSKMEKAEIIFDSY